MKLIIATRNPHKLEEIRAIFPFSGLEVVSVEEFSSVPEIEEDGDTFEVNAVKKAATTALIAGHWALADDSGLEVECLGGEPGVRSARFAGEPPDYQANNAKLLDAMRGMEDRRARFTCVMALASPAGQCRVEQGRCTGRIAGEPRGDGGFGYDPVFIPDGHDITFAEMASDQKNRISHRGVALAAAKEAWAGILSG